MTGHRAHTVYIGVHLPGERRHTHRRHHKHHHNKTADDEDDVEIPSKFSHEILNSILVFVKNILLFKHSDKGQINYLIVHRIFHCVTVYSLR